MYIGSSAMFLCPICVSELGGNAFALSCHV
jgi:hypothetical protein